ncbi:MarR family transcriptional regulator [Peterkaempfera bronchialis]|uniref:MarR family transcriptional regulator n=2 Tax=Peterkaempfera bronchialis TaxID=2126346 RepID=A0A345T525_9ACTN|nr:MarR family transcriptional regulator [Peterkaempfera bronchialis]
MRLARRLRAEREPDGLALGRVSVLDRLERDGPATASALAAAERITPQSMARIVRYLAGAGLIERDQDPSDHRAAILRITEEGRELALCDRRQRDAWLSRAMAAHLTEVERDVLLLAARLMDRLAAA